MAQLPNPLPNLDAQGRAVYDYLAGPRGGVGGMYLALLNDPPLARQVGELGSYLRFHGRLPDATRELAILAIARHLGVAYEWEQHAPLAMAADVPQAVIDQLCSARIGPPAMDPSQADICFAARHVAAQESIPDALQERLQQALGLEGLVELITLCGFYRCIATIVTAFDVALPNAGAAPF